MEIAAYTDGSFKDVKGFGPVYAGATIICRDGADPVVLTSVGTEDSYIKMRNVAGEITAVMLACEYCLNTLKVTQEDTLVIIYDYAGIESWCKRPKEPGFWRAKTPLTSYYRDFINTKVKTRCKVLFKHVDAHTGSSNGNDMADSYAKEAISNYVMKMRSNGKDG